MSIGAIVLGCASAIRVQDELQPGADLSSLGGFLWRGGEISGGERLGPSRAELARTIEESLLAGLAQRGLTRAGEEDPAPVRMSWHLAVEPRVFETTLRDFGTTRGPMRRGAQRDIPFEYRYDEGTLSLEIHETETGALLWRAWAEAEIKPEATPAERRKRAGEAVGLLLERLDSR